MPVISEKSLSDLLSEDINLRFVEPHIYSLFQDMNVDSSYDNKFGNFYDLVACNPLYNRLIWGYSTKKFALLTQNALISSKNGWILDIGCGSLAFTAKTYVRYSERPVVLLDNSLNLLRIAKSRLIKSNGKIPENMVFLHADALQLPFEPDNFDTIICLNLLHVLDDVKGLLVGLKELLVDNGKIYFTTLVKGERIGDNYLKVWENRGELVSRDINQLQTIFNETKMPIRYDINGNMAFLCYEGRTSSLAPGFQIFEAKR